MPPSTVDERLRGDYEGNMNGEPDALKGARPVRKGIERKGLATAPRSQSTLHLDRLVWEKVKEVLANYEWVRSRVEELRAQNKPTIDTEGIEQTIATISQS